MGSLERAGALVATAMPRPWKPTGLPTWTQPAPPPFRQLASMASALISVLDALASEGIVSVNLLEQRQAGATRTVLDAVFEASNDGGLLTSDSAAELMAVSAADGLSSACARADAVLRQVAPAMLC